LAGYQLSAAIFGLAVGPEYSKALVADVFAMCR
jgi:hypothetical protein